MAENKMKYISAMGHYLFVKTYFFGTKVSQV